ncbi:MAG: tRNA pseudouridine(38-40) synthase TruA [Deltaproteobacteria bacterium]|nr:tRNA pseudouridine(38-40) synthase TruA [Deltaproteobacteria bacterium]
MRNIRLLIEYDGTEYAGWHAQAVQPTVQGRVIEAIRRLTGERVKLAGASRTDAGVHALGQAANFLTGSSMPATGLRKGLNSLLPSDIVIKAAEEAVPGFDSRRDAKGKIYLYRILNRAYPSALLRRYSWFVYKPLDIGLMREGAGYLVGEKDFSSFRAADSDALHFVRKVASVRIEERGHGIIEVEVKGTAFLRHMVRIMAGTLVELGKGDKLKPEDMQGIIEARDRTAAPMTAPPQGLFLMKVEY